MRTLKTMILFFALFILYLPRSSLAWPPKFGREAEFSNSAVYHNISKQIEVQKQFAQRVREKCAALSPPCIPFDGKADAIENESKLFKAAIKFEDGFWIKVTADTGVIEVKAKELTLAELQSKEKLLQELLYDTAVELGLQTNYIVGQANHLNISLDSFETGEELLRYYTDYANHPELASGVLYKDLDSAAPLGTKASSSQALSSYIKEISNEPKTRSEVVRYLISLQKDVREFALNCLSAGLYQKEEQRIEMRAVKMMATAREDNLMAELQQKRMEYLRREKPPIKYLYASVAPKEYTQKELAERFALYLAEMDADWDHYSVLFSADPTLKPSAFLRGVDRWADPDYVKDVKASVSQAIEDPFYRKRLLAALSKEDALKSGKGVEILGEIASRLTPFTPKETEQKIRSLLAASLVVHDWRNSPQRTGLIAAIDKKLRMISIDKVEKIVSGSCLIQKLKARFSR